MQWSIFFLHLRTTGLDEKLLSFLAVPTSLTNMVMVPSASLVCPKQPESASHLCVVACGSDFQEEERVQIPGRMERERKLEQSLIHCYQNVVLKTLGVRIATFAALLSNSVDDEDTRQIILHGVQEMIQLVKRQHQEKEIKRFPQQKTPSPDAFSPLLSSSPTSMCVFQAREPMHVRNFRG